MTYDLSSEKAGFKACLANATCSATLRHLIYRVDAVAFLQLCIEGFQAYVYYEAAMEGEAAPHLLVCLASTSILFAHGGAALVESS